MKFDRITAGKAPLAAAAVLLGVTAATGTVLTQAVGMSPEPRETAVQTQVLGEVEFNTEVATSAQLDAEVLGVTTTAGDATTTVASEAPATTATLPAPTTTNAQSDIGAATLALLPYDVEANIPDWTIVFLGPQSGIRGLAMPAEKRIELYVREGDTAESLVRVLAHEVGHAVDISLNSGDERDAWRAARGLDPEVPWWPNGVSFDFDTGAGDFAEAFATVMVGSESKSHVGGELTPAQADLVMELATS